MPRVRAGLSLLETTIAIAVIVTGLLAAFTLVFANRRAGRDASLRFGAVAAAREGIEVARAIRDSNWLAGRAWDAGIAGNGGTYTGVLRFSPVTAAWELGYGAAAFTSAATRIVRRTTATGEAYWAQGAEQDDAAPATPYRRLIATHPVCADGSVAESGVPCDMVANPKVGVRVRSRVQWTDQGRTHEITAEERLYDWR